jgi:amidase
VGLLARDPAVLRSAAAVLLGDRGASSEAPARRLLLDTNALAAAEPDVADSVRAATERLAGRLGGTLETVELLSGDAPDFAAAMEAFSVLQGAEVWRNFGGWVESAHPSFGADIATRIEGASRIGAADVARAEPVAAAVAARVGRIGANDVLAIPATGTVAPPRDADADTRQAARVAAGRLSCLASLAGAPAVALPGPSVDGLPVGVSLVGAPGSDRSLLAAARAVSR